MANEAFKDYGPSANTPISLDPVGDAKLLEQSVAHWHENKAALEEREYDKIDIGVDGCALCRKYRQDMVTCMPCPIARFSGQNCCRNTPHHDAQTAFNSAAYSCTNTVLKLIAEAFAAEIDFLEMLRDKVAAEAAQQLQQPQLGI